MVRALFFVGLLSFPALAKADALSDARTAVHAGRYSDAIAAADKSNDQAVLRLGFQAAMESGDFAKAKTFAAKIKTKDMHAGTHREALILAARGQRKQALQRMLSIRKKGDYQLEADIARLYWDTGDRKSAEKIFKSLRAAYRSGKLKRKNANDMLIVADAAAYLSLFEYANDYYDDAVAKDPNLFDANVRWGYLFLHKYNQQDAQERFQDVLQRNPSHPDALAGMARVVLESRYDLAKANEYLRQALITNKNHVPSLVVRAGLAIDRNEWKAANQAIDRILKIDSGNLEALALRATIQWLADETAAYEQTKKRVFALNPKYAEFYHIIGRSAVREHRYKKAIELEKAAVKIDPEYHEAMQAIGSGYLRLGDEKNGLAWLEKAWKGDQYNVRTFNLLNLFDETIPKEYEFVQAGDLRIRYHKKEAPVLRKVVEPFLVESYKDMVRRYKFTPEKPLTIEMFRNPEHYSVRTVGLPNLGALGVCFGKVVTARSPHAGDMNWGMVMFHELSHVFAIQLSNSRVPRWYTEGLSEYETMRADPTWRRENDADLAGLLRGDGIPSVVNLNHMFMSTKMSHVMNAYYLSAVTIEYLVGNYGFDKIVVGLKEYGKGKDTAQVIKVITGKSAKQFDSEFNTFLKRRLARYMGQFQLPAEGYDDVAKWEAKVAADPKSAAAHAGVALSWFYQGDAERASMAANRALSLNKNNGIANYVVGEMAYLQRNYAQARKSFDALLQGGHDSWEIRGRLGSIAAKMNKSKEAIDQWCRAKTLRPEWSVPYGELFEIYKGQNKMTEAIRELESYVAIEQMQVTPAKQLVEYLIARKQWHKAARFASHAILISPADPALHLAAANANIELGRGKKAERNAELAVSIKPGLRRPAEAHLALSRALALQGRKKDAVVSVKRALALEPQHKAANAHLKTLQK